MGPDAKPTAPLVGGGRLFGHVDGMRSGNSGARTAHWPMRGRAGCCSLPACCGASAHGLCRVGYILLGVFGLGGLFLKKFEHVWGTGHWRSVCPDPDVSGSPRPNGPGFSFRQSSAVWPAYDYSCCFVQAFRTWLAPCCSRPGGSAADMRLLPFSGERHVGEHVDLAEFGKIVGRRQRLADVVKLVPAHSTPVATTQWTERS